MQKSVYQFKITLKGITPPIWRQIQVPQNYSFFDLHVAIQDAMGWEDCHLHSFRIIDPRSRTKVEVGFPDEDFGMEILPGWEQKISDYFTPENNTASYEYDSGDSWEHKVKLEKFLPVEAGVKYPACIAGKRACPPEDVGGIYGYEGFLEAIKDPDPNNEEHEEHEEMLEWVGGEFDPEFFEPKKVVFENPKERFQMMMGSFKH